jgi:hypothetical protein
MSVALTLIATTLEVGTVALAALAGVATATCAKMSMNAQTVLPGAATERDATTVMAPISALVSPDFLGMVMCAPTSMSAWTRPALSLQRATIASGRTLALARLVTLVMVTFAMM